MPKPPGCLASTCRRRCSLAPTRGSNDEASHVHHAARRDANGSTRPTPEETMLARLKWRGIATSLLAAAAVAAFLKSTEAQTPAGQPITIGFGMALTGPLAGFGKQALL